MTNLVNLNVNPCKMCMPMGAVSALAGIRHCMTILHGSQGCATYIRRHMATHYNEPIDIASSSLTEQGTVFGGKDNLKKGLKNLIDLYDPELIGVCSTCLAETIGEDAGAIIQEFYAENPSAKAKAITVASPGYGGSQNEGWFAALDAIVRQTEPDTRPNNKVNIITPQISPADTRWLKGFLSEMGVDYILLPDISESLDGGAAKQYRRLKSGGSSLEDIARMSGARLTIEFSEFSAGNNSPAEYLGTAHAVPLVRLPLPVGLRGMRMLVQSLEAVGGTVTEAMDKERGRYLDAMIDSHKYCAEARAAVFGEPDFVLAVASLCAENGILPAVVATALPGLALQQALEPLTRECRDFRFAGDFADDPADGIRACCDSDFAEIERLCTEMGVNLLIGSSDARRISQKLDIPLIRCAFPIHDHIGGQRVRILGYDGSLSLLDQAANAMISRTESGFRKLLYGRFFAQQPSGGEGVAAESCAAGGDAGGAAVKGAVGRVVSCAANCKDAAADKWPKAQRAAVHPCFDEQAHHYARVHLPIAPECNIQCNYCLREFDCANECRPGVSSKLLGPRQALEHYQDLKKRLPNLTIVGIAGPGDALADFARVSEALRLIRGFDPEVGFCIATNGLMLPQCVDGLRALGVSHATVTVNAIDPKLGAKIYKHVRFMGKTYTGVAGASILLANQLSGIRMLVDAGITVKLNCVAIKGVNDGHIFAITKAAAKLGATMTNIMAQIPIKGSVFGHLEKIDGSELAALRAKCATNIKQMTHCRQCRADAAGTLGNDLSPVLREIAKPSPKAGPKAAGRCRFVTQESAAV